MTISHLTRECHQRLDLTIILILNQSIQQTLIVSCSLAGVANHHRLSLTTNLIDGVMHEVIQHHVCLTQLDIGILVQFVINHTQGFLLFKELVTILVWILLDKLKHSVVALIVFNHIQNEFLIDGLLHGIEVMRLAIDAIEGIGLILRCGSEGEIRDMSHLSAHHLHIGHQRIHFAFKLCRIKSLNLSQVFISRKRIHQILGALITNGCMSLVDDDGIITMLFALQVFQRIGKLLNS